MKCLSKRLLLSLLALGLTAGLFAQHAVTGMVVDTDKVPVIGATVVLQSMDSTFLEAAVTDVEGMFALHSDTLPYLLTVQHVVYETLQRAFGSYEAGVLVLEAKSNLLHELVVTGEKPFVKAEEGKLVYNTQLLTDNRIASTAWDVLGDLPGVTVKDGAVSLIGARSVAVKFVYKLNGFKSKENKAVDTSRFGH